MEEWAGTAPSSPSDPLSSATLLNSAESTEMRITSDPQACPHPVAVGYCFGAEAEGTSLCALGHHSDGGNCHTRRQSDGPWEGVTVRGKVARASGIQGALPVQGRGKCC